MGSTTTPPPPRRGGFPSRHSCVVRKYVLMGLSSFIASQAKSEFLQDDNQNFLLRKRAAPIERSENCNRAMVSSLIPPMETEVGRNERLRAALACGLCRFAIITSCVLSAAFIGPSSCDLAPR